MPANAQNIQPTAFISYAHESDSLRASVKALADWLGNHGCRVLTDHLYVHRPPEQGWPVWMHDCVGKADTVLVVCAPKLKARYEKNEEPDTGRGATFEGAIITQHLYENAMRNTKFYPVLPDDGGREADIPTTLKAWWNGHRFPSGNEGIRCMIFNEPAAEGLPTTLPAADAPSQPGDIQITRGPFRFQEDFARKLLGSEGAPLFLRALQSEIPAEFGCIKPPDASAVITWFSQSPADPEHIQRLFWVVRRALDAVPSGGREPAIRRQSEEVAAALYCLAARWLIDRSAHEAGLQASGVYRYLVQVPKSERLICALIANALFGGVLRLMPDEQPEWPRPEYMFEIEDALGGDQLFEDFERAAFVALFGNDREAPEIRLDAGPLSQRQREMLKARFRTIKGKNRATLAFVVQGIVAGDAPQGFATTYEVPVMVPGTEAAAALLGMQVDTLLAEIREFWREMREMKMLPGSAAPQQDRSSLASGGSPMSSSGPIFNIGNVSGGLAVAAGDHSAAQAGTSHTAHVDHRQGADLTDLIPLLRELAEEIGKLPSSEKRDGLAAHLELAQHEVGKTDRPRDAGRIKRALDVVKSGADGLENSGKIMILCNKAYNVIAPLLGLPPSPVP